MSEYVIREAKTPDLTKFTVLLNDIQIDGNIHNLLSKLSDLNERVFGEDNTNIQFKDIADRIDSGKIDRMHTVDTRSYFNPEIKEQNTELTNSIILANTYTYIAIKLKENNSIMMAWNAVSEARHHVGYCYGICDSLVRTTAERASKGGQANAKKKSDFKKNVIHALQSLPPQKSRKTPSVIAKKIAQNLINSPHQLKGTQAEIMISLISKIWNMIEEDKEVKSAFNVQPSKDQKSSLSHT